MKNRANRIAVAAQSHAFMVLCGGRAFFSLGISAALTGLHSKSFADGCVRLISRIWYKLPYSQHFKSSIRTKR
ncbi:hypothetical protein Y032_0068g210 [Ancylostoma ceylanicum]|uniref:Uncharacterized protein n=1 Tax=Ancylostoma ceylanicum TaxID=53326 RepID=A0A016TYS4_9BILA|nr:hypothetical protein Y032_0068g210 [Ancylostoma ceylanicum]